MAAQHQHAHTVSRCWPGSKRPSLFTFWFGNRPPALELQLEQRELLGRHRDKYDHILKEVVARFGSGEWAVCAVVMSATRDGRLLLGLHWFG